MYGDIPASSLPSSKLTRLWKITMFHRYMNYKWLFLIAMFHYQRVSGCWTCECWGFIGWWVSFYSLFGSHSKIIPSKVNLCRKGTHLCFSTWTQMAIDSPFGFWAHLDLVCGSKNLRCSMPTSNRSKTVACKWKVKTPLPPCELYWFGRIHSVLFPPKDG